MATAVVPVSYVRTKPALQSFDVDLKPTDKPKIVRLQLDESIPDSFSIISYIDELSVRFGQSPYVREFVVKKILCNVTKDNAKEEQVSWIVKAVKQWVTYINDPVGGEYFISPVQMISEMMQGKKPKGDCDDHVLLLNTMLNSIGIRTRAVGVHLFNKDLFDHVISEVEVRPGKWETIDPCAKKVKQPNYSQRLIHTF